MKIHDKQRIYNGNTSFTERLNGVECSRELSWNDYMIVKTESGSRYLLRLSDVLKMCEHFDFNLELSKSNRAVISPIFK